MIIYTQIMAPEWDIDGAMRKNAEARQFLPPMFPVPKATGSSEGLRYKVRAWYKSDRHNRRYDKRLARLAGNLIR